MLHAGAPQFDQLSNHSSCLSMQQDMLDQQEQSYNQSIPGEAKTVHLANEADAAAASCHHCVIMLCHVRAIPENHCASFEQWLRFRAGIILVCIPVPKMTHTLGHIQLMQHFLYGMSHGLS